MDPSKNPTDPEDSEKHPRMQHRESIIDEEDPDTSYLSEMIDDVIIPSNDADERFDVLLSHRVEEPTTDTRRYDERDYQSHRRESFPHTHHPLKPLHSRSMRKKHSISSRQSDYNDGNEASNSAKILPSTVELQESQSEIQMGSNPEEDYDDELDEPFESCPLLEYGGFDYQGIGLTGNEQKPGPSRYNDMAEPASKKVQFEVGGEVPVVSGTDLYNQERRKHKAHRSHQYEDPQWRRRQGSEMLDANSPLMLMGIDERDPHMPDLDQDDLTSHRYEDNKGFRRHRFFPRGFDDQTVVPGGKAVRFDHQPHEIFVELSVLTTIDEKHMWREMARWIKYEEDVEELADRWGKPHVASLSFHSLINVRKLIEMGVCLLDLEERDLPGVAYRVVEQMIIGDLIRPQDKGSVMRSILLKHKHVNEHEGGWRFNLRRNTQSGSLTSLQAVIDDRRSKSVAEGAGLVRRNSATSRLLPETLINSHNGHITVHAEHSLPITSSRQHVDLTKIASNLSEDDLKWMMNKESIMRRIPTGSEASIVMVGKDDSLEQPTMAFVRLAESVYMPNVTEVPIPVRFVYILLGPSSLDMDYKEIGRSISTLMSNRHFHEIAYKASNRKHLLKGIHEFLDESIVLPPGDWDTDMFPFDDLKETSQALRRRIEKRRSIALAHKGVGDAPDGGRKPLVKEPFDPLKRTKIPFGGMINEIRRRYPYYASDFIDALNFQTIATIIFIYFAAVSGAIAFGGILNVKTLGNIGISETLISTAGAGVFFSLLAGQPLIIVGSTGPLLLFDESLFRFTQQHNLDFLSMRFWIGIWCAIIGILVCAAEGSVVARYISRFTQEIFASLISLLFIAESVFSMVQIYQNNPILKTYGKCDVNHTLVVDPGDPFPNTALLSTLLCVGTFAIAYSCRAIKTSKYLTETIRKFLGNFGVPIAIVMMVGIDFILMENSTTEKLKVPAGLQNTNKRPSWLVDMTKTEPLIVVACVLPALLLFILIFMETSICGLIIGKKDQKLVKGGGFHLDILLLSIINSGIGCIGGAWMCAATVRAVTHTSALTVFSTNNPPGEKPTILGAKEQRVSAFTVSLLVGLSVLMSPVLVLIPKPVLFGVFLYMGISSMSGIQFFERCTLLIKQVQNHPQVPYVRRVRTMKMHLFTCIQILCLVLLWVVKMTPAALILPFLLILLVPFRMFVLSGIFKPAELSALDSKGADAEPPEEPVPEMSQLVVDDPLKKPQVGIHGINGNNHLNFRSI